jgi:hypothetical protein
MPQNVVELDVYVLMEDVDGIVVEEIGQLKGGIVLISGHARRLC